MRFSNNESLQQKSKDQAERLLQLIFQSDDLIQFQALKGKKSFIKYWTIDQFLENIEQFQNLNDEGYNIYFGINPRAEESAKSSAVKIAHAAFIDIDGVEVSTGRDMFESDFGYYPTADWKSGGGYQAICLFDGPIPVNVWQSIQTGLMQAVNSMDSTIADAPQLARLTGFFNVKAKYGPDFPFAEIAHVDDMMVFRPEDFPQGQVFENEVVESAIEVPDGYLSKDAKAFLEDGTLPCSANGEAVGRRQMAFRVACEAKASNIPIDEITEQIVEACSKLDLDVDDLDDLPRQINNAYGKECLPRIDEEDLPKVKLPDIDRTPKLSLILTDGGIVARLENQTTKYVDAVKVEKARDRARFIKDVKEKFGDDADLEAIDAELINAAAGDSDKIEAPPRPTSNDEIDAGQILRPELFHVPSANGSVTGITVPVMFQSGPAWMTHLKKGNDRSAEFLYPICEVDDVTYQIAPELHEPTEFAATWERHDRLNWIDKGGESLKPKQMFSKIIELIKRFVDMGDDHPEEMFEFMATYVVLTYQPHHFWSYPYLQFCGTKGSGKSRVLETFNELFHRPMIAVNLSPSALFRELDQLKPTLLLDEAEHLHHADVGAWAEIRAMVLAGNRRGAKIKRCQGEDHTPVSFDVSGFKVFSSQKEPDETLGSRCIITYMERCSGTSEKSNIGPYETKYAREFQDVRNALFRFTIERSDEIHQYATGDVSISTDLFPRTREIWAPILKIAQLLETEGCLGLVDRLKALALHKQGQLSSLSVSEVDLAVLQAAAKLCADNIKDPKLHPEPTAKDIALHATNLGDAGDISARRASPILRRYKWANRKLHGSYVYKATPQYLGQIQDRHQLELLPESVAKEIGIPEKVEVTPLRTTSPTSPTSPDCDNSAVSDDARGDVEKGEVTLPTSPPTTTSPQKASKTPSKTTKGDVGDVGDVVSGGVVEEKFELDTKPKPKRRRRRKADAPAEEMIQPGEVEL